MRYFLYAGLLVGTTTLVGPVFGTPPAMAACPYNSLSDCLDDFKSATKKVITDHTNALEHAKEAGKATGNCQKCATEELSNQFRKLTPNSNSGARTAR